ncbi:MAG: protein kinase [Candidatus Zixiibacteriota bacterium]|nr:MAG: protein kinase [candidate division Zixibacteria bacterium]
MSADGSNDDRTKSFITLTADSTVSHYKIIRKIGAGGMGIVYLAHDTELNRRVALKFLPPQVCQDDDCRVRFKREAQAAAVLSHPNIITIHEVAEHEGQPFFAMEHVEGKSLSELIKGKEISLDQAIGLTIQMCDGLDNAHQAGVTHRDIKPSNIVVDKSGRLKLLDFGLATVAGTDKLTRTGSTLGTAGYMSPEQTEGKATDHRSDLFSLGVVLYEMITGRRPFDRDSDVATIRAIVSDTQEPLARYKANVPDDLQRVVDKALQKDASLRYQSAAGMLADLKLLKVEARPRKPWTGVVSIAAATAAMLLIASYFIFRSFAPGPSAERKMLAVLPFENLGSSEDEYFADGITEEITTHLAKLSGLGVISRTSAIKYKDTDKSLRQIGKELRADHILEGTIRWDKSGEVEQVRINSQLIRVSDDSHVWADTYDRAMVEIFALQTEIAKAVAEQLNVALLETERASVESKPTDDLAAYNAYLRGMDLDGTRAVQMFQRAIELDPDFALAWAELSMAHSWLWNDGYHEPERLDSIKAAADQALELEPGLPEAHLALALYYFYPLRQYEPALDELRIAQNGLPNDSRVMSYIGSVQKRKGLFEEGLVQIRRAFELSPQDPWAAHQVGVLLMRLRRYDEALAYYDSAIVVAPDVGYLHVYKIWTHLLMGDLPASRYALGSWPNPGPINQYWQNVFERRTEEAREWLDSLPNLRDFTVYEYGSVEMMAARLYELTGEQELAHKAYESDRVYLESELEKRPDDDRVLGALGIVYAGLGRKEDAVRAGRRAVELHPVSADAMGGPNRLEELAYTYTLMGEFDQALDQIDSLLSIPCLFSVGALKIDSRWDSLRDHPRFQALIEE